MLDLFYELDDLLSDILHRLRLLTEKETGLSGATFFLLHRMHVKGPQTVTELSEVMGVTMPAITGLVDRLCSLDFAERRRDEEDRRIVWVCISEQGKAMMEKVEEKRAKLLSDILTHISPEKKARLFMGLVKDEEIDC